MRPTSRGRASSRRSAFASSRAARSVATTGRVRRPSPWSTKSSFADTWPDVDPIGQRLHLPGPDETTYPVEIVGVVGNSKFRSLGEEQRPAIYEAYAQRSHGQRVAHVFVRKRPGAALSPHEVARALTALDPSMAVEVSTMRDTLAFAFMPSRVGRGAAGMRSARSGCCSRWRACSLWCRTRSAGGRARSASGWRSARTAGG